MIPTKTEISPTDIFFSVPYTDVIPKRAAKIPPSKKIPMIPKGDATYNCLKLIGFVVWNIGAGLTESKIGANDKETATEIIINKINYYK